MLFENIVKLTQMLFLLITKVFNPVNVVYFSTRRVL